MKANGVQSYFGYIDFHCMVKSSAIASQPLAHMQKKLRPPKWYGLQLG